MTEPFDAKEFTQDNLPIGRYAEPVVVNLVQDTYERARDDIEAELEIHRRLLGEATDNCWKLRKELQEKLNEYERGRNDGLEETRKKAAAVIFKFNSEPISISHGATKVATPQCKRMLMELEDEIRALKREPK